MVRRWLVVLTIVCGLMGCGSGNSGGQAAQSNALVSTDPVPTTSTSIRTDSTTSSATFPTTLTQQQLDDVTAIIDGDTRVTSITGPHPTERDVAPWSQDNPNRFVGAVASVAVTGGPSSIAADVPSWECIDGRFRGGIFHTEATNVSRLMVWVDLQQREVVAIIPDALSGARITGPLERIADAYFPEGDCQTSD